MVKVLKPVPENPVYSKILFTINDNPKHILEIAKILNKTNVTLSIQIHYLEKDGYVILRKDKYDKKKKVYFVNWDKIMLIFYDVFITFANEKFKVKETKTEYFYTKTKKTDFHKFLLKNIYSEVEYPLYTTIKKIYTEEFKNNFLKNKYLLYIVKHIFGHLFHYKKLDFSIKEVFFYFFKSNNIFENLEKNLKLELLLEEHHSKEKNSFYEKIYNLLIKEKDYIFFRELSFICSFLKDVTDLDLIFEDVNEEFISYVIERVIKKLPMGKPIRKGLRLSSDPLEEV